MKWAKAFNLRKQNYCLSNNVLKSSSSPKNELGESSDRYEIKPEELVVVAAKSLALQKLQKDECQTVVGLIEEYKLQINEPEYEEKLYINVL